MITLQYAIDHLKNEENSIYETKDGLYSQISELKTRTGLIYARIDDGIDRIVSVSVFK